MEKEEYEFSSQGLTSQDVAERISAGKVNGKTNLPTKSVGEILATNFFQLFNLINLILAVLVIFVGKAPKQAVFCIPALINLVLGIIQELRAKFTVEKLSLIHALKATVVRDGSRKEIPIHEVVLDDIMLLDAGKQICADSEVLEGDCEVNESLLTGESDPIVKKQGDKLMSGSFVVSGKVIAKVTAVGKDSYANKISSGARYIKQTNSEIVKSMRGVIRIMSIIVVPLGLLLFFSDYLLKEDTTVATSMVKMVASMSSMIPQGLVALISAVFAIGVIRLSRHKTLAQDLYCIETLARVDVLCLDKTGTITEGSMQVENIIPKGDTTPEQVDFALKSLVTFLPDNNPTYNAIKDYYGDKRAEDSPTFIVPFSSSRKWSGVALGKKGTYILGAPEFVCRKFAEENEEELKEFTERGERVLVLVHSPIGITQNTLPEELTLLAFVVICDKIRKEAPQTLKFFAEEGVDIRIISGDNPVTVSAIAKKAGLANSSFIDMSTITTDEELIEASRKYKVFGRVTPLQKMKLVKALQADNHVVGMTGDGVNDVLALKEADCSIAVAAGSDAARNVAQLVLLDNKFDNMPRILAEGRRSINNLTRSASLFLVKTVYAVLLSVIFMIPGIAYPFSSTNLTLIGMAMVGIPGVLLALEPNNDVVKGKFLSNVMTKAIPGGVGIAINLVFLQIINGILANVTGVGLTGPQLSTASVVILAFSELAVLYLASRPFSIRHTCIFVLCIGIFFTGWGLCQVQLPGFLSEFNNFFDMTSITEITPNMHYIMWPLAIVSVALIVLTCRGFEKYFATHDVFIKRLANFDRHQEPVWGKLKRKYSERRERKNKKGN